MSWLKQHLLDLWVSMDSTAVDSTSFPDLIVSIELEFWMGFDFGFSAPWDCESPPWEDAGFGFVITSLQDLWKQIEFQWVVRAIFKKRKSSIQIHECFPIGIQPIAWVESWSRPSKSPLDHYVDLKFSTLWS